MAGKSAIPDEVIARWVSHRDSRLSEGASSLWDIAKELAAGTDYHFHTIYRYLNPEARERANELARGYYTRKIEELRKIKLQGRQKARRRRQNHLPAVQRQQRAYRRVTRNIGKWYLADIYSTRTEADLNTIVHEIRERSGVQFKESTILAALETHVQARAPPVLDNEDGVYRLAEDSHT